MSSRKLSLYVRLINYLCHCFGHLADFDVDTYTQQLQVVKIYHLFTAKNATSNLLLWYHFPKDYKHHAICRHLQISNVLHIDEKFDILICIRANLHCSIAVIECLFIVLFYNHLAFFKNQND
ncbi:hypothetical protein RFI_33537 [Reticulomyxa filosa]|uniref:Uncharacterized protein n=1 Tax=Reticulomyxa filosa TaxID=46433 RepID=X6LQJ0_RETFI|nr:hypothetical protein RFI_33537 [Reticulomyxa filosa]|eukprot:ETO03864.1 hypothetical protein RFI_33537 [Reticulomyxa filosa]